MQANSLTLIVDGKWLLMTQVYNTGKLLEKDTPEAYDRLRNNFLDVLNGTLKKMSCFDNWILVSDRGQSWRKSLPRPGCVTDTYKGQRQQDEKYNWNEIQKTYDSLLEYIRNQGVTVSAADSVEGDDWCAWWSGWLFKRGISSIIWSRDHDLMQLVKYDDNAFTGWWNQKDGLYLHKGFGDNDGFFSPLTRSNLLLDRIRPSVTQIRHIDPYTDILIPKIFNGDVSDNIKPVIYMIRNGRTYRLNKKELPYHIDLTDEDKVREFLETKLTEDKYARLLLTDVSEHLKYNRRLVELKSSFFPKPVIEIMQRNAGEYLRAPMTVEHLEYNSAAAELDSIIELF